MFALSMPWATEPATASARDKNGHLQSDGTITNLVCLLQHTDQNGNTYRGYMYNFANLVNFVTDSDKSWETPRSTVEFRQHGCGLDIDTFRHWVLFVRAIVGKPEDNAMTDTGGERNDEGYVVKEGGKYGGWGGSLARSEREGVCGWIFRTR
jgi:hypothetical protein